MVGHSNWAKRSSFLHKSQPLIEIEAFDKNRNRKPPWIRLGMRSMEICGLLCLPLDEEALLMLMTFDLSYFFEDDHDDLKRKYKSLVGMGWVSNWSGSRKYLTHQIKVGMGRVNNWRSGSSITHQFNVGMESGVEFRLETRISSKKTPSCVRKEASQEQEALLWSISRQKTAQETSTSMVIIFIY